MKEETDMFRFIVGCESCLYHSDDEGRTVE